jgi:hypothetical protein
MLREVIHLMDQHHYKAGVVVATPSEWTMKVNQAMWIFRLANGLQEREYHISFTLQ